MIAIHTKFLPATNTTGSRIKAYTPSWGDRKGFTATVPYNHALSGHLVHFEAVKELIRKNNLNWSTDGMRYGDSADGKGFTFCFDNSRV